MKMVRAIVRPEREEDVLRALEARDLWAFTRMDVFGRGRQQGIQIGAAKYDELAKSLFMVVVEDEDLPKALEAFEAGARTGNPGDGKVFISEVEQAITVRTGEKTL
jgi:nitrogen regulatory protein PII 1